LPTSIFKEKKHTESFAELKKAHTFASLLTASPPLAKGSKKDEKGA